MVSIDNIFREQVDFFVIQPSKLDLDNLLNSSLENNLDYKAIVIDGENCLTKADFFEEVSSRLNFPEYFGGNWDAFYDSFADNLWSQSNTKCILIILNTDKLLSHAGEIDFITLLGVIKDTINEVSVSENINRSLKIIFVSENIRESKAAKIMEKQSLTYQKLS